MLSPVTKTKNKNRRHYKENFQPTIFMVNIFLNFKTSNISNQKSQKYF